MNIKSIINNPDKASVLNLAISIFFAVLIIITALITKESGNSKDITFLLIAMWLVPFFWLSNKSKRK